MISSTPLSDIINISIHFMGIVTTMWEFGQDEYAESTWHIINRLIKINIGI